MRQGWRLAGILQAGGSAFCEVSVSKRAIVIMSRTGAILVPLVFKLCLPAFSSSQDELPPPRVSPSWGGGGGGYTQACEVSWPMSWSPLSFFWGELKPPTFQHQLGPVGAFLTNKAESIPRAVSVLVATIPVQLL